MTAGRAPESGPPLVSIVIAFLDGERFLREAIDSVFAQTYERWELLLVDDGSGPAASTIALEYASRAPARVRYLEHDRHENRGLSASRNLGISAAGGAYTAFLDADDVWLPDKLRDQVAILESRPDVGAMYGNALYWYGWTGDPADVARDFYPSLRVSDGTVLDPPRLLERLLTGTALVPCAHSLLTRTAVLRRVGGFEERFRGMFEDQAFYAKLMLAERVLVVDRSWERYRQHPGSMCAVADRAGTTREAHRRYLEWLAEYLDAQSCDDQGVGHALRRALRPFHRPRVDQGCPTGRVPRAMAPRSEPVARPAHAARPVVSTLGRLAGLMLPGPIEKWLRRRRLGDAPVPPGDVRFGDLRRLTPMSRAFGFDRGQPVDRHYIDTFLRRHASDIRGRVLEVGDASYTRRFGGQLVSRSDVLHVNDGNPHATIVADLAEGDAIPSAAFDCVILTQTLHLIYDVHAAVATLRRILAPHGACLITVPGISQIDSGTWRDSWYWAFTPASLRRLLAESFGTSVDVHSFGNVLAASAFLYGLSASELTPEELAVGDASYPVIVAARVSIG